MAKNNFKCRLCTFCNGKACKNELPGMGGVDDNFNFKANCEEWKTVFEKLSAAEKEKAKSLVLKSNFVLCAPVTGAKQNIGFEREADFYPLYIKTALEKGFGVCIGDGEPDEKLLLGIKATKAANTLAHVFCKPYPQEKLLARSEWAAEVALSIGVDIDAYNIKTMQKSCALEQKTVAQLKELRAHTKKPLSIKGVFSKEDLSLCKELRPDIAIISNHGGRVKRGRGSTALFLAEHAKELLDCSGEVWVDGGIRQEEDLRTALALGAKKVLVGRPLIQEVIKTLLLKG